MAKNPTAVATDCRRLSEQLRSEADRWSGETRRRMIRNASIMMKLSRVCMMPNNDPMAQIADISDTCDAAREIIVLAAADRIDREWAAMQ